MSQVKNYDVLVVGVGGMGSSSCYHLAKRGVRVAGIEQFSLGHDRGSSHGDTRTIRLAYYEHEHYVPLLRRAYALWEELSRESNHQLLHGGGLISYGPHEGGRGILEGILKSAAIHHIPVEKLSRNEAIKRYPGYLPPENFYAVFEPSAGYLEVEHCVRTYATLAQHHGADIFDQQEMLTWEASPAGIKVVTKQHIFQAQHMIITAGAWTGNILKELSLPLKVHRNSLFWFESMGQFHKCNVPSFTFDLPYGFFYGLPDVHGTGVKLAEHKPGTLVRNPTTLDRKLSKHDSQPVLRCIHDVLPSLSTHIKKHVVCMYTMTPDGHFIIDRHPAHPNILFAAGFSGHGFKFSSIMGEILTQLVLEEKTPHPIDFLHLSRFASSSASTS